MGGEDPSVDQVGNTGRLLTKAVHLAIETIQRVGACECRGLGKGGGGVSIALWRGGGGGGGSIGLGGGKGAGATLLAA
jgi:hypothetical protein